MKEKYLLVKTDGSRQSVSIDEANWLNCVYSLLNCDCIEIVQTLLRDVVMIVDESGKMKAGWEKRVNICASQFYAGAQFGDPIVGDAIFAYRIGPDLFPLPNDMHVKLISILNRIDEVAL